MGTGRGLGLIMVERSWSSVDTYDMIHLYKMVISSTVKRIQNKKGQDNTGVKALTFHVAVSYSITGTIYGSLSTARSIPSGSE